MYNLEVILVKKGEVVGKEFVIDAVKDSEEVFKQINCKTHRLVALCDCTIKLPPEFQIPEGMEAVVIVEIPQDSKPPTFLYLEGRINAKVYCSIPKQTEVEE